MNVHYWLELCYDVVVQGHHSTCQDMRFSATIPLLLMPCLRCNTNRERVVWQPFLSPLQPSAFAPRWSSSLQGESTVPVAHHWVTVLHVRKSTKTSKYLGDPMYKDSKKMMNQKSQKSNSEVGSGRSQLLCTLCLPVHKRKTCIHLTYLI